MTESDIFLNDCWALHFHDPHNNQWDLKSYKLVHTISSVQDWVQLDKSFHDMWDAGMFFLMREHIQPMWEDEHNASGGCLSYKVNKPDAKEYWFQLGAKALGEVLSKHVGLSESICGVSISPKRHFCILRIWLGKPSSGEQFHLEAPHYSQVMYKTHNEQKNYHAH
jgi:hypothetical protein